LPHALWMLPDPRRDELFQSPYLLLHVHLAGFHECFSWPGLHVKQWFHFYRQYQMGFA